MPRLVLDYEYHTGDASLDATASSHTEIAVQSATVTRGQSRVLAVF